MHRISSFLHKWIGNESCCSFIAAQRSYCSCSSTFGIVDCYVWIAAISPSLLPSFLFYFYVHGTPFWLARVYYKCYLFEMGVRSWRLSCNFYFYIRTLRRRASSSCLATCTSFTPNYSQLLLLLLLLLPLLEFICTPLVSLRSSAVKADLEVSMVALFSFSRSSNRCNYRSAALPFMAWMAMAERGLSTGTIIELLVDVVSALNWVQKLLVWLSLCVVALCSCALY